jgi:hypothetical protein
MVEVEGFVGKTTMENNLKTGFLRTNTFIKD